VKKVLLKPTRTFYCFVFVSHVEVRFDISLIKELID